MSEARYAGYRLRYSIADSFKFMGENTLLQGGNKQDIVLGEFSYMGDFGYVEVGFDESFKLGVNCRVGRFFHAQTFGYDPDEAFTPGTLIKKGGCIVVGDGCWIGRNVHILPGISVGANTVVGAGSVVTKDLPADSVCAGVPCRVLHKKKPV